MKKVLCVVLAGMATIAHAQQEKELKLWYRQPAGSRWESALPVGNGRLGAMVYGNVELENIQLNEGTVWSGSPNRNDYPEMLTALPEARRLIFEGKQAEAQKYLEQAVKFSKSSGQMFEPVGSLRLAFDGHENFTDYRRELDIRRGVAKTFYTAGGARYTREVLASLPDRVIVMRLTCDKPGGLSFRAFYTTPEMNASRTTRGDGERTTHGGGERATRGDGEGTTHGGGERATRGDGELVIAGTTMDHETVKGMVKYEGTTRIRAEGGRVTSTDTSLVVSGADAATIYISIATNFVNYHDLGGDAHGRAEEYMGRAWAKDT